MSVFHEATQSHHVARRATGPDAMEDAAGKVCHLERSSLLQCVIAHRAIAAIGHGRCDCHRCRQQRCCLKSLIRVHRRKHPIRILRSPLSPLLSLSLIFLFLQTRRWGLPKRACCCSRTLTSTTTTRRDFCSLLTLADPISLSALVSYG
jgi:hypothetical protein